MKKLIGIFFLASGMSFAQNIEVSENSEPFIMEFFKEFPNVRDISISKNQQEMYFTILGFKKEFSFIAISNFENGKWSKPKVASFSGQHKDLEPFLSPDNLKLFFASNRPLSNETKTDFDLWMVERATLSSNWGKAINLGTSINTLKDEFYPAVTNSGNLYFTATIDKDTKGKEDIYLSVFEKGNYAAPKSISTAINSETYEFNAYVSPDENIILFSSYNRLDGVGGVDLYISTKGSDGFWKPALNLGSSINSDKIDYCPFLDLNTNTLYYTSEKSIQKTNFDQPMEMDAILKHFYTSPNGLSRIFRADIIRKDID